MSWRAIFERSIDIANTLATLVCFLLLGAITAVTVMQVFLRFVLNSPTSWSEEIAILCLIWFGLLAVAVGIRRHEHLAIMALRDVLPARAARLLDFLAHIAIAAFMFTVVFFGRDLVTLVSAQALPASGWSRSLLYIPAVIGGSLGFVNALANIVLGDLHRPPFEVTEAADDS